MNRSEVEMNVISSLKSYYTTLHSFSTSKYYKIAWTIDCHFVLCFRAPAKACHLSGGRQLQQIILWQRRVRKSADVSIRGCFLQLFLRGLFQGD
jgi:hypothetical protein